MVALAHRTGTRVHLGREAAMQGLALLGSATRLPTRQPICLQLYAQRNCAAQTCRAVGAMSKRYLAQPQDGRIGRRGTLALVVSAEARSRDCDKTKRRRLGFIPLALTPRQRGLVLLNVSLARTGIM